MKAPHIVIAVVAGVVLVGGFAIGGQFVGATLFAKLQKLPDSVVGVTTLYRYWQVYGDVKPVRQALGVCSLVAAAITAVPFVFGAVVVARLHKERDLHGSARFATLAEIRRSGLVGLDR
jgi:type IV secretion system protein VirD4